MFNPHTFHKKGGHLLHEDEVRQKLFFLQFVLEAELHFSVFQ